MSAVSPTTRYTAEDLLAMDGGRGYELVNGELVRIDMGAQSSWIGGELHRRLGNHNESNQHGWVFAADTGYQCFSDDPDKVRKPDASFVRLGRFPNEQLPEGWIRIAPDLAAEVVSPNNLADELQTKVQEYLDAGVALVWVIYPESRTVMVHRRDGSTHKLRQADELSGEDILPEFSSRVVDLFPPKPTEQ